MNAHDEGHSWIGVVLAIAAGFFMSCVSLVVKLAASLPFYEKMIARCFGMVVFSTPLMIYFKQPFIPTNLKDSVFIFGRSLFGSMGDIFLFISFSHIPIGDATALAFTSPVWSAILAYFVLDEGWSPIYDSVAVILCLAGTVLITRPSFIFPPEKPNPEYDMAWLAYVLALAASLSLSLSYICVRKVKSTGQSFIFTLYYGVVGILLSVGIGLVYKGFKFSDCGTIDNIYALLCGLFSFLGQVLVVAALKVERAAIVALGRATDIAFVYVLQVAVLHIPVSVLSIVGAILVLSCNLSVIFQKWFPDRKNKEK